MINFEVVTKEGRIKAIVLNCKDWYEALQKYSSNQDIITTVVWDLPMDGKLKFLVHIDENLNEELFIKICYKNIIA